MENEMFYHKYSFEISVEKMKEGIKNSDFLVADNNCTHRLIGVKYKFNDESPIITRICSCYEMATAKQIAFSLGKKIYYDNLLSGLLYSKYQPGEEISFSEFKPIAELYAKYMKVKRINM
jgi:type III secretory pathway component EscU